MNCKQGDLAIVVISAAGNEGKIIRCIRLATQREIYEKSFCPTEPVWVIDRPLLTNWDEYCALARDSSLRPIRPSEGQDETLSWKDVPQGEIA